MQPATIATADLVTVTGGDQRSLRPPECFKGSCTYFGNSTDQGVEYIRRNNMGHELGRGYVQDGNVYRAIDPRAPQPRFSLDEPAPSNR